MTAYNEAKEAYKTAQDTAVNAARTEITQTQNYINEINTAISNIGQKENIKENEQLPDWYKDIENKWYCPNIDNAAEKAGAVINGDEAKAGDIVLFD